MILNRTILISIFICILGPAWAKAPLDPNTYGPYKNVRILNAVDGDSIKVLMNIWPEVLAMAVGIML